MTIIHPSLNQETLSPTSLEVAETIPSAWYTDSYFEKFDREAVFTTTWQYVGSESRLLKPGDYLSSVLGNTPIVVVRDTDNSLRAFYNVCKHRGGPLVMDKCGTERMLQCKYHGWTYKLDGSLRGVPRFDRTELFDKKDFGLETLDLSVWEGHIFVRPKNQHGNRPDLETLMSGIASQIEPIDLRELTYHCRVSYEVKCNWKVYVDNYLEGYHLPLVHPELCDALDVRSYQTDVYEYHSLQHSPIQGGSPYGEADSAFYYFVYPNFMMNLMPGRLQTNIVLPVSSDRCIVHFDYHYSDQSSARGLKRIEDDLDFSERVQMEDVQICEHVQLGLDSPAYDRGRFSVEAEAGVHHFQSLLTNDYSRHVEILSADAGRAE